MAFSFKKGVMLLLLVQILSACGWVHDQPKPTASFQTKNLDVTCLTQVPIQLQVLFAGQYTSSVADQQQVSLIWSCLNHALDVFANNTLGADPNYYTAKELEQFANRYFPQDHQLTDNFANAIFKLKQAVLGGTDTQITRPEISRLEGKLTLFGKYIGPLSSQLGALLTPINFPQEDRKIAISDLNKFVLDFASLLSDSINPLRWSDLISFVTELEKYTSKGAPTALTYAREQLPVFQYFKLLLVGGDESLIENDKWQPIFQDVSQLYNALYLSSTNAELLENLNIEVLSTESNQRRAVDKISGLLEALKLDPTLYSSHTIQVLADRWAKVLMVNSFLFSNSQGGLAIKPFLDSPEIRKMSGYLIDQVLAIKPDSISDDLVRSLAERVSKIIELAGDANTSDISMTSSLSTSSFKDYCASLRGLLTDPTQIDQIDAGIDVLSSALPIVIGKDSDLVTPSDLSATIQKSVDVYLAWKSSPTRSISEAIGVSFDVIQQSPAPTYIRADQAATAIQNLQKFLTVLKIKNAIDWDQVQTYIKNGFDAKALLFSSSNQGVNIEELKILANVYEPFRDSSGDLAVEMSSAATALRSDPFASIKIIDLYNEVNSFLPVGSTLDKKGFKPETIGIIKALLIGGSSTTLDKTEYTKLMTAGANLYHDLSADVKALPKGFAFGLNPLSMKLTELFLNSLAKIVGTNGIQYVDLRNALLSYGAQAGYTVRQNSVDEFLIGLQTRMFGKQQGAKPTTLSGAISSDNILALAAMVDGIKSDLSDLSDVYQGTDLNTGLISKTDLLAKLKSPTTKMLIQKINPQLMNGNTGMLYLPDAGKKFTAYTYFDLSIKILFQNLLNWVYLDYKIEADPDQPQALRWSLSDLTDVLSDIGDIAYDFKVTHSNVAPDIAAQHRMETVNIFTEVGNGDNYADFYEILDFLVIAVGSGPVFDSVHKDLVMSCYPTTQDYRTVDQISVDCVNNYFFTLPFLQKNYGAAIPQMVEAYQALTDADRDAFRISTMTTAVPNWQTQKTINLSDLETLAPLYYYLETIFERLDTNMDGKLEFSEAMAGFPIFCNEIQTSGNLSGSCVPGENPGRVEVVYGFLLWYGFPPSGNIVQFLEWQHFWNHLDMDPAVRDANPPQLTRNDLLAIVSNLATTSSTDNLNQLGSSASSVEVPQAGALPGSR